MSLRKEFKSLQKDWWDFRYDQICCCAVCGCLILKGWAYQFRAAPAPVPEQSYSITDNHSASYYCRRCGKERFEPENK